MLQEFGKPSFAGTVDRRRVGHRGLRPGVRVALPVAALTFCLGIAGTVQAQVVEAGDAGRLQISAGATESGYYLQYGGRKMLGVTGFVDIDSRSHFGLELEGRWLEWNKIANVHVETYSMGPRYHKNIGKLQIYGKGMLGYGNFNFPYNLAQGRYLIVTGGGGLDYHFRDRVYIRALDVEYQYWPQFTYGAMSSVGASAGIRVLLF
jgi:hypothetical protein